jgi:thymidylate synthase
MIVYNNVNMIREEFKWLLANEFYVEDKSGVKLLEIVNASFVADEPSIFGKPNDSYIEREIEWYKSMSLNVNDIPGETPAVWKQVATPDGRINSNYGWCVWSRENGEQYNNVLRELKQKPTSRRATMIYTRPSMWVDYSRDGMSDFMCTNAVQYVIRDQSVHAIVQMRSNDVFYGYRNDYAWNEYVLKMLSHDLDVSPGIIYWNVGSLHVYERNFNLVK